MVSHRYTLDEINEGIARLEQGEATRGVVVFD
jgi:Zn-dependent alcohol dehydrogenase